MDKQGLMPMLLRWDSEAATEEKIRRILVLRSGPATEDEITSVVRLLDEAALNIALAGLILKGEVTVERDPEAAPDADPDEAYVYSRWSEGPDDPVLTN